MKTMKWLLMIAVLTGFAACGEDVAIIEDVKIYLKNGTDGRAIDYCHYASHSPSDKPWSAFGKEILYIAGTIPSGEQHYLYGLWGISIPSFIPRDYTIIIRISNGEEWIVGLLIIRKMNPEDKESIYFELTEEMVKRMLELGELGHPESGSMSSEIIIETDRLNIILIKCAVLKDKTIYDGSIDVFKTEIAVPYWDTWTDQGDFPVNNASGLNVKLDEKKMFYFVYNDVVYGINTADGKRTRLGEVTEEEKTQNLSR